MPVVLVGTLDTKGKEFGFARELLQAAGLTTLVVDAGCLDAPAIAPDISREAVFQAANAELSALIEGGDRGAAVAKAAEGAAVVVRRLFDAGKVDGVLGLGGSAGTTIGTAAMRGLPFGVPKVMVSTLASGQTRPFVQGSDILMAHPVADVAGLNRLTRIAIGNAANAIVGMVRGASTLRERSERDRPLIGASMFGVTTPCVDEARRVLDLAGYEVLVFHATGVGGRSLEDLIAGGQIAGVLDATTTELADEVVGGVLSAGPDRLKAAALAGVPQVVSVGAVDMVNFGPIDTVPERFRSRTFHVHNANVTLMRTTAEENREIGRRIASALRLATGPTALVLPLGGVSALDAPGKPFYDLEADGALFETLRAETAGHDRIQLLERPEHINDPEFARALARTLLDLQAAKRSDS